MAQLSNVRFRATDSAGAVVSGAGLYIYETGTTTLADIFTDADLTVPAANPLTSNASGYWAQFYIAPGQTVDIYARQTVSALATLLWQALKVDSVGLEDISSFLRDFGADGRLQARGDDGLVHLEFMPPTGDNIGGAGRIGGAAGTQADTLEIDAALATVTGDLDVDGEIQASKILAAGSLSGTFTDISLSSSYDFFILRMRDVRISAAGSILLAFGHASGIKIGASDYVASLAGGSGAVSNGILTLVSTAETHVNGGADYDIRLATNGNITRANGVVACVGNNNVLSTITNQLFAGGTNGTAYGRATTLRVRSSTESGANVTGSFVLYGIRSAL